MQNRRRPLQRSVAVQSTDLPDTNMELESLPTRLCKKAGFRNLLQKSVTVVPQRNAEKIEGVLPPGGKMSKSIQVSEREDQEFHKYPLNDDRGLEFGGSKATISEFTRFVGRGTRSENPGTSGISSTAFGSNSLLLKMNELYRRQQDGSLEVVHNYDDKSMPNSRSSNLFYYGSQGSRRFSDETVLLIEDYQSYDYMNAAGRQEQSTGNQSSKLFRCVGRSRRSTNSLIRPVPISVEPIDEDDERVVCRICHEGEEVETLLQPCLCKGSVGSVHGSCLKKWLEQSNTSRCELCNYPYAIRQSKKYSKWVSVRVFFSSIIDKRSLLYDAISFVVITPLAIVGVAMCIQASIFSTGGEDAADSNFHMGNITKAGMIMLSATILVAYGVWLYTLISYHYKAWRKWYNNCYDVEVLPVRMTSEERLEAFQKLNEELNRRQLSREYASAAITVLNSPHPPTYSFRRSEMSAIESAR